MPNNQQATRRVKQSAAANERNKSDRSRLRTAIKILLTAVAKKDASNAKILFPGTQKLIDAMAQKRIIPKNTARRYKKRLNLKVKSIAV